MRKLQHVSAVVVLAAMLGACSTAAQQTPREPEQKQEANAPAPVVGELVYVNTDTKTIRVKKADNSEMEFSYTPETEVLGADKGLSGLATLNGSEVTVHFSPHGQANVATKIEIQQKKG